MKAVIQRVDRGSCTVDGKITGEISKGLVILLGITHDDTEKEAQKLADKITNLRIFPNQEGDRHFESSLLDTKGGALVISQFTLYANTKKCRRPDFAEAAKPEVAEPLYKKFIELMKNQGVKTEEGVFGAMMDIELVNSGPVSIIVQESR